MSERIEWSEQAWADAPIGASAVVDMTTGARWIEPPAEPVSPEEFISRHTRA